MHRDRAVGERQLSSRELSSDTGARLRMPASTSTTTARSGTRPPTAQPTLNDIRDSYAARLVAHNERIPAEMLAASHAAALLPGAVNGKLYFTANDEIHGTELWVLDTRDPNLASGLIAPAAAT
jgi:dipeptidyl aminopeptidase/acylaminoacyl peptidase